MKNGLFDIRTKLAKLRKTENWNQTDLNNVIKHLKTNKAADPKGLISEIFKPGVAGADLIQSLLVLCNKVKDDCQIPGFVIQCDDCRSIMYNLMYNDYYDIIDNNMSDSNVGGRKKKNIRDNLFIVYGIINFAVQEKVEVDLNLYVFRLNVVSGNNE